MEKPPLKVANNQPNLFFQYCQPAQNQSKSHYATYVHIMTLVCKCEAHDQICQILKKFSPFLARLETALEFRAEEA